jgi:hypothetical protein
MKEILTYAKDLFDGVTSVAVALTTLFAALSVFWRDIRRWLKRIAKRIAKRTGKEDDHGHDVASPPPSVPLLRGRGPTTGQLSARKIFAGLCLTVLVAVIFVNLYPDPRPINEILTRKAWLPFKKAENTFIESHTLDRKLFTQAITNAELVIDQFLGSAQNDQQKATRDNMPPPPSGTDVPAPERERIFRLGLVNDVATCWYIKGRSLEYVGDLAGARAAYEAATNFPHARTWDPRTHGFWPPAEAALGRLAQMRKQ